MRKYVLRLYNPYDRDLMALHHYYGSRFSAIIANALRCCIQGAGYKIRVPDKLTRYIHFDEDKQVVGIYLHNVSDAQVERYLGSLTPRTINSTVKTILRTCLEPFPYEVYAMQPEDVLYYEKQRKEKALTGKEVQGVSTDSEAEAVQKHLQDPPAQKTSGGTHRAEQEKKASTPVDKPDETGDTRADARIDAIEDKPGSEAKDTERKERNAAPVIIPEAAPVPPAAKKEPPASPSPAAHINREEAEEDMIDIDDLVDNLSI